MTTDMTTGHLCAKNLKRRQNRGSQTMKRIGVILCLCLSFSSTCLSAGELSGTQNIEVAYLLESLSQSGCTFTRNGNAHTPEEAVAHIQKKQALFQDKIDTTEEFIEYSAARSTLSGK